eukprot:241200-Rhodomonas_salina.2
MARMTVTRTESTIAVSGRRPGCTEEEGSMGQDLLVHACARSEQTRKACIAKTKARNRCPESCNAGCLLLISAWAGLLAFGFGAWITRRVRSERKSAG